HSFRADSRLTIQSVETGSDEPIQRNQLFLKPEACKTLFPSLDVIHSDYVTTVIFMSLTSLVNYSVTHYSENRRVSEVAEWLWPTCNQKQK
ncbi:MAG TPA: hypothetical protein VIU43_07015, partial [Nitrosospira sp.]